MCRESDQPRKHPRGAACEAAEQGRRKALLKELNRGCDVDTPDYGGMTPLMYAAIGGHVDCVRLLLQRGADVRKSIDGCGGAAHLAAMWGHPKALTAVLAAGCNVDSTDDGGITPLMYAAIQGRVSCVRLLLRRGADARKVTKLQETFVHCAARSGDKETLLIALAAGCDINARDSYGNTPLMLETIYHHRECCRLLLQRGADARIRTDTGRTTVHYAAEQGDKEMLIAFLDAGCPVDEMDDTKMTPLMCTVKTAQMDSWHLLVQRGADLHSRASGGRTLAHIAAQFGHTEMLLAVLDAGCDADSPDDDMLTPFMYAVERWHGDCVEVLLQHGANADRHWGGGRTAAHTFAQRGDAKLLLAVLDAGCEVDGEDGKKVTPLVCAVLNGRADCCELLLRRGADPCKILCVFLYPSFDRARSGDKQTLQVLLASEVDTWPLLRVLFVVWFQRSREYINAVSYALACGFRLDAPSHDEHFLLPLFSVNSKVCGL